MSLKFDGCGVSGNDLAGNKGFRLEIWIARGKLNLSLSKFKLDALK